jgi:C4-dicarboxylate transporter
MTLAMSSTTVPGPVAPTAWRVWRSAMKSSAGVRLQATVFRYLPASGTSSGAAPSRCICPLAKSSAPVSGTEITAASHRPCTA